MDTDKGTNPGILFQHSSFPISVCYEFQAVDSFGCDTNVNLTMANETLGQRTCEFESYYCIHIHYVMYVVFMIVFVSNLTSSGLDSF